MNSTQTQTGYHFDEQDLSCIRDFAERRHHATGITVSCDTQESHGFAVATLGVDNAFLRFKGDVVMVQSWAPEAGIVEFAVLAALDKQPIGERHTFPTLLEALVVADLFLKRFIEGLVDQRAKETLANSQPNFAFAGSVIESGILSVEDVHYVQSFANDLGRVCGLAGFAKFIESSAGVMSIILGVMNKEVPIILGAVIAVSNETGRFCTVRDLQDRAMPGPDNYKTIESALTSTRPSFEKLAQITARQVRPSLVDRLLGR